MDYSQFEIFRDITDREVEAMIRCFHMRQDAFQPGETICTYGDGGQEVGVVVEGEAELVRFDLAGARTILERLEEGSVFGEALAFTAQLGDCVEVVCARPCRVLFMEYAHIMKRCEKACLHHSKLVHNMFRLVSQQTQGLSRRVEVLSRRSIRDKLQCYFQIRRLETGSDTFTLPFTLSALADYISTDRSANEASTHPRVAPSVRSTVASKIRSRSPAAAVPISTTSPVSSVAPAAHAAAEAMAPRTAVA